MIDCELRTGTRIIAKIEGVFAVKFDAEFSFNNSHHFLSLKYLLFALLEEIYFVSIKYSPIMVCPPIVNLG